MTQTVSVLCVWVFLQVAFMHMAKNVTWRYFMQLWLELLTLDQRENLQSDPASDMGVAAADLDEDGFLAVIGGDAMEAYLANKVWCSERERGERGALW